MTTPPLALALVSALTAFMSAGCHPSSTPDDSGAEKSSEDPERTEGAVFITSCLVLSSHVGARLDIRCEALAPGGLESLADGWSLNGGPEGAAVQDGLIFTEDILETTDVGSYDYDITVADNINQSASYTFSAPIDELVAYLIFEPPVSSTPPMSRLYRKMLPENVGDAIADACDADFDPANKPNSAEDAPYILNLPGTCAGQVINSLATEQADTLLRYPLWLNDELNGDPFLRDHDDPYEEMLHFLPRAEVVEILYQGAM